MELFQLVTLSFLIAIVFVSKVFSSQVDEELEGSGLESNNHEWDVLIFTQQWPVTACFHWMKEDAKNSCILPDKKEFWTVHGIWPTKYGKTGPSFCNKSIEFDAKKLDPIVNELSIYWPNIEEDQDADSLWKHEWDKHGTCAAQLPELQTEVAYFEKGLEWRKKYLISDILGSFGIHPDSEHTIINLQTAFKKILNCNPSIHCLYDRKKGASYLSEIRLCFNKTMDLIDCDGVMGTSVDYPGGKVITNCHISEPVQYPSLVPPIEKPTWKFPFVNFYKLLNFIMWFTL